MANNKERGEKNAVEVLALIEIGWNEHSRARREVTRTSLRMAIEMALQEQGRVFGIHSAEIREWEIRCVRRTPTAAFPEDAPLSPLVGRPTVFKMHEQLCQFVQENEETEPEFYLALLSNFTAIAMSCDSAHEFLCQEEERGN